MQTLATSPSRQNLQRSCPSARIGGFTLLELVVVLALLGVVAALALPNLSRLYDSLSRTTERDYILNQLSGLGQHAQTMRTNLIVHGNNGEKPAASESAEQSLFPSRREDEGSDEANDSYLVFIEHELDVPDGWTLELQEPLRVFANGVCLGTDVTLAHSSGASYRTTLSAPYCNERS